MSLLRSLFGPSKEEIWRQFADQIHATFNPGGLFDTPKLTARTDHWTVTLDGRQGGSRDPGYTRMRAPFLNTENFRFTLYSITPISELGHMLGMQKIQTGDSHFDGEFVVKGNNEEKIRQFFNDPQLKSLLYRQPTIQFQIKDHEGFFGDYIPNNCDELFFQCPGTMKDLTHLRALYDLFAYTLHRLCHLGSAYESDPNIIL